MDTASDGSTVMTVLDATPPRKGHPLAAWIVIVTLVLAIVVHLFEPRIAGVHSKEHVGLLLFKIQAQSLVGVSEWDQHNRDSVFKQAAALNTGTVDQRLRFVILAGDLSGPREALKQLHQLDEKLVQQGIELTPTQARLRQILRKLYLSYLRNEFPATSVSDDERRELQQELGWFGELALAPAQGPDTEARLAVLGPAQQTVVVLMAAAIGFGVLGLAGFLGLLVFLILLFTGKLPSGLRGGSSAGGIYAETFAVWMVLFVGLRFVGPWLPVADAPLLVSGMVSLASMAALLWPVARGIPWRQVRQDIGLTAGKLPLVEPLLGAVGYVIALPLMAMGLLVTILILILLGSLKGGGLAGDQFGSPAVPSHPIMEFAASPSWWLRFQVLLLGSFVAPLVEETMFRGVLYRHLRESTSGLGFAGSVLLSATVVSFLFAVIHPQGLAAVPALMGIALALALIREWRGTLSPSMVTHGINNGVMLLVFMLAAGG
jgi:membrane protease YdiL (CAAX protease family)